MATLTVTIQEEISVNGRNVDSTTVSTFSADEVIHTTTNIGTAEASIFLFVIMLSLNQSSFDVKF